MRKVEPDGYREYITSAENNSCNRVYPLSIAEGFQTGDIYTNMEDDNETVLFWHHCGFAYITGSVSEQFLHRLCEDDCFVNGRRMILITDDDHAADFFSRKNAVIGQRAEYDYALSHNTGRPEERPERIVEIDRRNIELASGRITPRFSWESAEQFLENGFGYMALDGEKYCGAAFSAAVSSDEIDIGVEVAEEYRRRGLASVLAGKMCSEILMKGKKPVWAHAVQNTGSMRTALRCGFTVKKVNTFIRVR